MSPEQINGEEYSFNADLWSLGCIVFEICALNFAFWSDFDY